MDERSCFNPCFCGTRARTLCPYLLRSPGLRVSILVFVELAPGLGIYNIGINLVTEFQSLFLWNSRPDASENSLFSFGTA